MNIDPLKKYYQKQRATQIDNLVFKLHYRLTATLLFGFSIVTTGNEFIGDSISCISEDSVKNIIDSYCWIQSTFTVPDHLQGRVGQDVVHAGVGGHIEGEHEVTRHLYYQWVCFTLFFQAIIFQIPRFLWKSWEGGRMKVLTANFETAVLNKAGNERVDFVKTFIAERKEQVRWYAYGFVICEVLNCINVITQIFFTDMFLNGEFLNYGSEVISFSGANSRENPMDRVFPKVSKCQFNKIGSSGSIIQIDSLCVLPLNIVNEKIYVFLWFWFIILSVISALQLIWRLFTMISSGLRTKVLQIKLNLDESEKGKKMYDLNFPTWFFINQFGNNVESYNFTAYFKSIFA